MSYDTDYYAWTQEQAAALRQAAELRINLPGVDLAHLAEEIEDMGNDTLDKIEGLTAQIIAHLLKLEYCPDPNPRRHWRGEVTAWRNTVARRAKRSPTALKLLALDDLCGDAVAELQAAYRHRGWTAALPDACPYALAQILDREFFPVNRHGLNDD